jgi:manganese-dependent inorganic pyrophosphatase
LVDHQQLSQLHPSINVNRIVEVIDHHALQNATIITDMPIVIDISPWGSITMCYFI